MEKFDSTTSSLMLVNCEFITNYIQLRLSHLFRGHGRPRIRFRAKLTGPTYTVTRDASIFRTRKKVFLCDLS